MRKEMEILHQFITAHQIRRSAPREKVIEVFLETERHLSVQDIAELVRKRYPKIGVATVYRAMKTACEAGLAREIDFGENNRRYEHLYAHRHHDHLVCTRCGYFVEISSPAIEKEQENIARTHGYRLSGHHHLLYGLCPGCCES